MVGGSGTAATWAGIGAGVRRSDARDLFVGSVPPRIGKPALMRDAWRQLLECCSEGPLAPLQPQMQKLEMGERSFFVSAFPFFVLYTSSSYIISSQFRCKLFILQHASITLRPVARRSKISTWPCLLDLVVFLLHIPSLFQFLGWNQILLVRTIGRSCCWIK